jgi:hypothetical protein
MKTNPLLMTIGRTTPGILASWLFAFILFSGSAYAQHQNLDLSIESGNSALASLVFDVQPTVYVNAGSLEAVGEGSPVVMDVKLNDLGEIDFTSALLNHVSTVIIRLDETQQLTQSIDASSFSALSSLSNILLYCSIAADQNLISGIQLIGLPNNVNTYYTISVAE